jgi:hypothetical protein
MQREAFVVHDRADVIGVRRFETEERADEVC